MKYFTVEELTEQDREHAHEILEQCAGKSVRDRFAIRVFNEYHDRFFTERAKTRVLDLGVASGIFLRQLYDDGYRELSATDVDDYRQPENHAIIREFRTLDLNRDPLPWPDRTFDIVSAWCVLPHLENPFHAEREIARVLRPGGVFVFTAPYLWSKPSRDYFLRRGDFRSYRATNNHISLFTPGVIKKSFSRAFDPVATEYHFRPKVFWGAKGKLRRLVWKAASASMKKRIARRWAYNAIYVMRKKV